MKFGAFAALWSGVMAQDLVLNIPEEAWLLVEPAVGGPGDVTF